MAGIPIPRKHNSPSLLAEFFKDAMNQLALGRGSERMKTALNSLPKHQQEEIRQRPPQDECKHLKGNGNKGDGPGSNYPVKDYAVWHHTFPDGTQRIACAICGKRWKPEDPDWQTAVAMISDSTNTPTSSEIAPIEQWRIKLPKYAYFKSEQEANEWLEEQNRTGKFQVSTVKPKVVFQDFFKAEKN